MTAATVREALVITGVTFIAAGVILGPVLWLLMGMPT